MTAAESLVRHLENPLSLDGFPLLVTACAGVVQSDLERADFATMLRHADTALYAAKAAGPGLVRLHSGHEGAQSQERLRIRAEARAALAAGGDEFLVYYQPMLRIADGQLLCVEALVRWQHDGRLMPPGEFLPEIVRGGEMPQLTRHVLNRSLHELRAASLTVPVSVNVPPELISDWLLREVGDALHRENLSSSLLIIEVTEEALMREPEKAAESLLALRATGVRVLLDDFGTGWSGLSSLRDLVVDGLKIDHGFVSRIVGDSSAAAIVRGISTLAADLDVLVIYEGAESKEVMDTLSEYGAGYVQGFVAARPMPIEDLARWMRINRSMGMHLG
jgi:EAL domain-containing protein (putative c-di-GMP-specific phosphodiesterase class I)